MRRLRGVGCEVGRRGVDECRDWFVAVSTVQPECAEGFRRVVVRTVFPQRTDEAVAIARTVGNQAYVAILRDSTARLPSVQVQTANGQPLCRNFDGSARCITRIGEAFERW